MLNGAELSSLFMLEHPVVYRLLPFLRVPSRVHSTDPLYIVGLLSALRPIMVTFRYPAGEKPLVLKFFSSGTSRD